MVANNPPVIHVARIDLTAGGVPQVYQLPASQILGAQDGGDISSALDNPTNDSFSSNRVCEFLSDRYLLLLTGVFKKNSGGVGNWGQVFIPDIPGLAGTDDAFSISGLVVLHPDGVPTLAYVWRQVNWNGSDAWISFTQNGTDWTSRSIRSSSDGKQPDSVGEAIVYRSTVFWATEQEDPATPANRTTIVSHDIKLNSSAAFSVFDFTCTGCDIALCVHKNKLFAFGVRDNAFASDGIRYELRRLDSGSFGSHDEHIHVESDSGGGQYPTTLHRGKAAMFTDPASGQLIIMMSGGQSSGTTVAPAGGAKVLRFASADIDNFDDNAGVDISSIVMGDLGNPTGAGGADRYLTGGSAASGNNIFHVIVDNQTVPGVAARVFIWVAALSSDTQCWEWKGINAEMEPVAGLVGIQLNEFVLSNSYAGTGQYYPRTAAVELEGIPEEVAGGTKFEFRGRGEDSAGVVTFYSNTEEEAPTTVVPIVGSLTVSAGLFTDLVAYFHLDGDALNSSGIGPGALFNNSVPFAAGKLGQGGDFPGTNNIQMINNGGEDAWELGLGGAPWSVSFWTNPDVLSGIQTFVHQSDFISEGWGIKLLSSGAIRINQNGSTFDTTAGAISTGSFQHVMVVSGGTAAAGGTGLVSVYVDNVLISSGTAIATAATTFNFGIGAGAAGDSGAEFFDGIIDDVAMWNGRALTTPERGYVYNSGSGFLLEGPTPFVPTPTIMGNTIIDMLPDNGNTLYSVVLNPVGIGEGEVGTLIANLVV